MLALGLLLLVILVVAFFASRILARVDLGPSLGEGGPTELTLPPGFQGNIFARGLDGPRFLTVGPDGQLYVADRGNDRIVILPDEDGDGQADEMRVFADELDRPHSLVWHQGDLYVGVPTGVIRLVDEDGDGRAEQRQTIVDGLPTGGHSTRTVAFLPDGRMVLSVGSSCNVCLEEDPRRAAVLVYDGPDGGGETVFASGLRNAVGLAVHPDSGALWATNNGRDFMGDDVPPDTVRIVEEGSDHGWPRCHAGDVVDPEFGSADACADVVQPLAQIQAHSAPLGLAFYTGQQFPAEYQGDLFIAYHGSWNRSVPTGYKVVRFPLDGSVPSGPLQDFATGWLSQEKDEASGRPVGLAVGPDGSLFVSDDKGGFIYRITYVGS